MFIYFWLLGINLIGILIITFYFLHTVFDLIPRRYYNILYVQKVVTQPKILNQTILSNLIHVTFKRIIFNLKYRNS